MKKKLMEEQQRKIKEQEENDPDKHLRPVKQFFDDERNPIEDEEEMPYASVELLINNRNVFANMRNPDPGKIYYHVHNPEDWLPYMRVVNEKQVLETWNTPLDTFYKMGNMTVPMTPNEVEEFQESVVSEIRASIVNTRSAHNLQTKFKPQKDQMVTEIGEYLVNLENYLTDRIDKKLSFFEQGNSKTKRRK